MKLDWKSILGAVFFVAALFVSGLAKAAEQGMSAANQNVLCSCTRTQFADPSCQVIKDQVFGAGAPGTGLPQNHTAQALPSSAGMPAAAAGQVRPTF